MISINTTELYAIYDSININLWISLSAGSSFLGALANFYTIAVLGLYKEFRKPNYQLILCVAVTDALCDAIFIPIEAFQSFHLIRYKSLLGTDAFCHWEAGFYAIFFSGSVIGQLVIAGNRFIAVYAPNFYRSRMTSRVAIGFWALISLVFPSLYYYGGLNTWIFYLLDPLVGDCIESDDQTIKLVRTTLTIYIPLAGTILIYLLIMGKILVTTPAQRMEVLKRARGSAAMFASMLFYGMCVLPLWIQQNADNYGEVLERTLWIKLIFRLSYAINPVFYLTLDGRIRAGYLKLFRRIFKMNQVSNSQRVDATQFAESND